MTWKIKKFDELTNIEQYNILRERTSVFVVEQNCAYEEIDGKDLNSYHVFKEEKERIITYLRIVPAGIAYEEISFGRVLVKKEHRGQGIAKELVNVALDFIQNELKEDTIKIQAQEYLHEFYSSFGFKSVSETYLEDNIPHIDMILKI
ncbi:GNAT family N-acetyltransferase [Bacillus sp. AFS059628]|uniref:GNAT family N-acetyltransferase n=1 Tax=Bacillus sp. AFS059628 TaxID=2033508 RepID=UPI000BF9E241|nr:GNAT family N-acetyltransferase [Bacillus sp. AFS059628]PFV82902.1 GNAT family N-acetyltransferase [Bacillus sp. AFS059628]